MPWFGDQLGGKAKVPEWASFFSSSQFAIFDTLVQSELKGRGIEYAIDDGVVVVGEGDEARRYGLLNLAQTCARVPPDRWAEVVEGHFDRLFAADDESAALAEKIGDFEAVRDALRVRLFPPEVEGPERVTWPVADGLVAALVFDLPSAIRTVSPDEAARWPKSLDELRAIGMANLSREEPPQHERFEAHGAALCALHGESFFTASHALSLTEANDPLLHPHGALVAVPTRHGVLYHPIVDMQVVHAVNALAIIADGMFREGPGGISPSIYWARSGRFLRIPTVIENGRLDVIPPESFVALLDTLASSSPS